MSASVAIQSKSDGAALGSGTRPDIREHGLNLFLTGFLVLFLELASIRWFAANVVFLQFFTNIVLLAAFLGMSCGCMAARQTREWLAAFPFIALGAVVAATGLSVLYARWSWLVVDVGHQTSPQEVFFGTEYRSPDVATFAIPIDVIVAVFFVLIALMFVGLGQVLGRAFSAYPNRIMGYTLNIGGSLAGIVGFSLLSLLHTPPLAWFFVCCAGVAYLLHRARALSFPRLLALGVLLADIALPSVFKPFHGQVETTWSPYYAVGYQPSERMVNVNNVAHQQMAPFDTTGSAYSLIYLLQRGVGGAPFHDVLVIGAGSGNDVDHALRYGVDRVDAVEIDPVIQNIGVQRNPDRPYADARVVPHIDDGRHFLRTTNRKYDLVIYALVDSLILQSGYANIRLESYLFTREALESIKRVLKPGGVFVSSNHFRQGWVVERVAAMSESVFGCKPTVISFPYRETVPASSRVGYTMIISGCSTRIPDAFRNNAVFWLNDVPPRNAGLNGFKVDPATFPPRDRAHWQRIASSRLVHDAGTPRFATDNWPFLYLRDRLIPDLNIREMLLLGFLGLGMVYLFLPKARENRRIDFRMFFLGAAFMLLETKAVVQLALLFGSTWVVNSLVFFTALLLVLLANLYVLRSSGKGLAWHYAGLLVLLAAAIATPLDVFLSGGILWRYLVPCALALGPIFFAGVIFARSFRESTDPDMAFGSNIAGSVLGGLSESFSMLLGFQYLLLLAVLFYVLSAAIRPRTFRGSITSFALEPGQ